MQLAVALDNDLFTPEYVLSPGETDSAKTPVEEGNAFLVDNYSYAFLRITDDGAGQLNDTRSREWSATLNTQAAVVGDRNTDSDADANGYNAAATDEGESIWTEADSDQWGGSVVRNDNSAGYENTSILEDLKYGSGPLIEVDSLFFEDADAGENALLFHR